jgi:adenosine deaminase
MPTLLVSLGTSPAIVPEAFLLPGVEFTAVHVLTTEKPDVSLVREFFARHAPKAALTITRVDGFTDFRSEADHFHFEEVLYRWILQTQTTRAERYVCLSGGFKTMSAAMQKAAAVLGAAQVFHVLCDLPAPQQPKTAKEIEAARSGGHLHWIKLGGESGWPQFQRDTTADFPLTLVKEQDGVRWVSAPDDAFRKRLSAIVERSHNIAGAWERIGDLPFPVLATWPNGALDWLSQPVNPETDRDWIASLPKVELHCHLGGFATHGELLQAVRASAEKKEKLPAIAEPPLPPDWPLPKSPISLKNYMELGNANGRQLLTDPGCLRRQCELLYRHFRQQNLLFAEVRCSPNNYISEGRSAWQVLTEIRATFQQCMDKDPGCQVNLLIIATRKDSGDRSDISRHLALAITAAQHWTSGCRVTGVDLAGFEHKETRAALFATDFEAVHRVGLAVTVHAGENDDAEGIWQAVFKLNARRLGHALHLVDAPDLQRAVADRGIAIELCPYANLQIKGYPLDAAVASAAPSDRYPLHNYLRAGIPVTINTDNIGISAASLTDNFLLAARLCPQLTRWDVLRLLAHAVQAAFLPPSERAQLRSRIQEHLHPPR